MLARILVYRWMVQCSGHPGTKAYVHLLPVVFFQFHLEERWSIDVQTRRDMSVTVENEGQVTTQC